MSVKLSATERHFVARVWRFYQREGRHELPWRQTTDPYRILVSELMLQQTQVERVIPKYIAFVKKWPTAQKLARAPLGDVLREWQGLGYNRRAKFLQQTAQKITRERAGVFPTTKKELLQLPGVGPYTASAVLAFAYNQPIVLIETNVRQVFIHHFFADKKQVTDAEIAELVSHTLPVGKTRDWFAALMDYGSYLKRQYGNLAKQSNQYVKQTTFKGSNRQIRGAILRLLASGSLTHEELISQLEFEVSRVELQVAILLKEALIHKKGRRFQLP